MNKNNFDFLRFLFAFTVAARHIIDLSQNKTLSHFEPYLSSQESVRGFFIISGFLIWKSYATTSSNFHFFEKRARRLLPAYLVCIFISALGLCFISKLSIYEYFTNKQLYVYLLANLTFLNFIQPCVPGVFEENWQCAVNGALWTIKVEVVFYIMVPFLYTIISKSSRKFIFLIAIYVLSILYKTYLEGLNSPLMSILSRQTPGYLCYFISGISFYEYFDFYKKNKNKLAILSCAVLATELYLGITVFEPFALAGLIFYAAYSIPSLNNFGKYGDFSYGMYIFHFTVIQLFIQYNFLEKHNPITSSILILSIAFILAILSWHFIEKPFLKRKPHEGVKKPNFSAITIEN